MPTKSTNSKKPSVLPPEPAAAINPFTTVTSGLSIFFHFATGPAIFLTVITILSVLYSIVMNIFDPASNTTAPSGTPANLSLQQLLFASLVVFVIALFITVVGTMVKGIQSYGVLAAAKGEKVTLGEAFNATLNKFGTFLILYIWMNVRIFLWSCLFIIPGIIAYYRFSFATVLFFDKDLRHEHALRESSRLTKGGLMTIFGSQAIFNIVTFYQISVLIESGSIAQLYRTYTELDAKNQPKPPVHGLSWLALLLTIGFILFVILAFIGLIAIIIAANPHLTK